MIRPISVSCEEQGKEVIRMAKAKLESRILDSIQRYDLIPHKELLVVGVSGGADSVCLLHVLAKWRKARIFTFSRRITCSSSQSPASGN